MILDPGSHRLTRTDVDASGVRLALFTDTFYPQVNGVTRTLDRLCEAVRARGGAVRVFTVADPEASDAEGERRYDIDRYASVPFWAYKQLRIAWPSTRRIRRQFLDFRPTLVHAATPFGIGLGGRRLALQCNVPIVSSYHTSFAAYVRHYRMGALTDFTWKFLRWFHNSTQRTYCPSQAIVDEVNMQGFRNTSVWSRGVDAHLFNPRARSTELRAVMGANDDTLVVTYVGRLAAEKGLDVATAAIRMAAELRPGKVLFSCIGDGPYEQEVRRQSPTASWLPGKLTGARLSEAYASGDVFIFPSTTDTFGNVMLEAMASGLPVIGADVGPTRELVGSDRGWIAPAGDAEAFARVIVRLVDDRQDLMQRRRAALVYAESSSWDGIWNRLIGDYLTVSAREHVPGKRVHARDVAVAR
ncbi:MAG: glycosyltransferase family 4 protein [Gemmatimonas sp.]